MHSLESVICFPQRDAAAHHLGRTLVTFFSERSLGVEDAVFVKGGVLGPVPLLLDRLIETWRERF